MRHFWQKFFYTIAIITIYYTSALASSVQITPISIELTPPKYHGYITIKNLDKKTLFLQTHTVRWTQKDGKDVYSDTKDILGMPLMATVQPGESQIFRIALVKAPDSQEEQAYRFYIKEVSPKATPAQSSGKMEAEVMFTMQLSVPVFVEPTNIHKGVNWTISKVASDKLRVTLTNNGNIQTSIGNLTLVPTKNPKVSLQKQVNISHILPQQNITFDFKLEDNQANLFNVGDDMILTAENAGLPSTTSHVKITTK